MIVVCAGIIYRGDKILIAQRRKGGDSEFEWEFPGGKIEEGESPEECMVREIREELDIEIGIESLFDVVYHKYSNREVLLIVYNCVFKGGEPKPIDCKDFKWINKKDASEYNFSDADKKILKKLTII